MNNFTNKDFKSLAKDFYNLKKYSNELYKKNKELEKENKHLKEIYDDSYKSFQKLFKRVNKAIGFIKENANYSGISFCSDLRYDECLELLKILKGE